ncbi:LacI family DNA-binding transcriptional regulator [Flavihumibacter petaseus]|uniref:Putative LacI family transcriptional regulator n=1 Tax=Flavihumibacter petaseus NBRC 106054 TaxID=1220578 RepID=A0A0E9MVI0_9BACT|nr:substrate-binding domain-containing protein [Flavihumibacter petaseus]GAO41589.1 putative LacI family transcriptional regulator [Flavihumibacter petaseus NBRC 106054]
MKRVSLKDIAESVGVSTALVSYVLNNKKEGRIGKAISEKIRETAKLMGYRTNQIARSLKTNKTLTIGLIVADISNPFSSSLARIIEDAADKYQYTVIFGSSDEKLSKFEKLIDTFLNRQVDGLIISPPDGAAAQISYLRQQQIPLVLLDRYFPEVPSNYVALDNHKASWDAVTYLVEKGRSRIGLINYRSELFHLNQRAQGYLDALRAKGITPLPEWQELLPLDAVPEGVPEAIDRLLHLPQPVDGLLFASNTLCATGLRHLNRLSLRVPDDLAIVTYDETESLDLFYAPLTYLRQPLPEMGRQAIDILLKAMENRQQTVQCQMEATLIPRASA